eukprot:CAMPEP_0115020688 /NCGR_PEP_ID=MMETSP0216-20121206/30337_1 /TAXON_ID=223996 /ORGANISM="Protocruzia adherens, Strain Boccale" /LENGTH=337 /DNA_ID=CAMNT_0002392695 /DNA_START=549 /DNA_END=1562 /DNA_ORIENTATION=+
MGICTSTTSSSSSSAPHDKRRHMHYRPDPRPDLRYPNMLGTETDFDTVDEVDLHNEGPVQVPVFLSKTLNRLAIVAEEEEAEESKHTESSFAEIEPFADASEVGSIAPSSISEGPRHSHRLRRGRFALVVSDRLHLHELSDSDPSINDSDTGHSLAALPESFVSERSFNSGSENLTSESFETRLRNSRNDLIRRSVEFGSLEVPYMDLQFGTRLRRSRTPIVILNDVSSDGDSLLRFGDSFDSIPSLDVFHREFNPFLMGERIVDHTPVINSLKQEVCYDPNVFDDKCGICLEDYQIGETTMTLRCRHAFHGDCLVLWLHKRLVCPMCKAEVKEESN